MIRIVKITGVVCALALSGAFCAGLAESDMPVAVDVPKTQEDIDREKAEAAERVKRAQRLLIDLGLLSGDADGIAGPMTEAAVRAFQEQKGLEVTGSLDEQTLAALEEMAGTVEAAKELQGRLIELGYLRGTADGVFGEQSLAALKLFQALQGLEVTGEADEATRQRLFSDEVQPLPARLSGGDKGERVAELQRRLIQFGFLSGEADGSYGKKTAAAVKRFQSHLQRQGMDESLGIAATGEATPATQALLFDPEYSSYIQDISVGSAGSEALRVESRLAQLGYMDAKADEAFDDYAARSGEAFQQAAGLEKGVLDRASIDALFAEDAPQAASFVPHAIAVGDSGLAVRRAQEALVRIGMTIKLPSGKYDESMQTTLQALHEYLTWRNSPDAPFFSNAEALTVEAQRVLCAGLVDCMPRVEGEGPDPEEVLRVQRRLHTLYYLSRGSVDGKFGDRSYAALSAFQQANGLEVTGGPDVATVQALFSEDAKANLRPYRVEVDIDRQRVYVFELQEDGGYQQTQTFVCSTGLGNSTPRGIFLDGFPANVWHHFEKYDCWARYSFEIEGNIMFHSVIYSEKDTDTLREGSVYALGSKASHGCIRLRVTDAKWLFEHCKRGSLVILIY